MLLGIPKLIGEVEGGPSLNVGLWLGSGDINATVWVVDGSEGVALEVAVDICFGSIFTGGFAMKGTRTGGASILRASRSGCSNGIVASKTATEH